MQEPRRQTPFQKWLARLSWTFLVLAVLLAWTGYGAMRGYSKPMPAWRVTTQYALAGCFAVLWLMGVKARHQLPDEPWGERKLEDREGHDQIECEDKNDLNY